MPRVGIGRQRGVSLVEAVVALAVLGFGILGVVGTQLALRTTSDVSKQRAEAVRIAQATLERARAYSVLDNPPLGSRAFTDLQDQNPTEVAGLATNTTFSVAIRTNDHFDDPAAPRSRAVAVTVTWPDRTGQTQSVVVNGLVAGVAPEIAGSLRVPGERTPGERARGGRHPAIPAAAVPQSGGTSRFTPPGEPDVVWVFDDRTGIITTICNPPDTCVSANALLLQGFVRFALPDPPVLPTGADAELPPTPPTTELRAALQVEVATTAPTTTTIPCFEDRTLPTAIAYYCAIPVPTTPPSVWSGRVALSGFGIVDTLTVNPTDRALSRVCRYTPVRGCQPAVGSTIWGSPGETLACSGSAPTPSRLMTNLDHPLVYANVGTPLVNDNYLVIRAGDGDGATVGTAFECPADDSTTPLINGNTWRHQPE
jgi:type II secretory pathway pseudopilin PulG